MADKIARSYPYMVYTGIVTEDLAEDSTVLKITVAELTPHALSGDIGPGITVAPVTLQNRDGSPISNTATTSNHVVATWKGKSGMRLPPMVRKGEPVEVHRVAGQDKWYWEETSKGREFRTTDRYHVEIGAMDPSKSGGDKDDTNTYSMLMDSVNKQVVLKTSRANGEAMAMSMKADLKGGTFHLSDDGASPGNRIFLDTGTVSGTPVFQVNLITGITFKLEGENAYLSIPKALMLNAEERIVLNSPLIVLNTAQKGTVIINAASMAINSAKDFIVTSAVVGISAASTKITGVLVAAGARIATLVKGPVGSSYSPAKVADHTTSPVAVSSNSADTGLSGPPYIT